MANKEQLAILMEGAKVWNEWRVEHLGVYVNLNDANLEYSNLSGANLSDAQLYNVNFKEANLKETKFFGSNLSMSDFYAANLMGTYFIGANLVGARFAGATLTAADLTSADLTTANLDHANLRMSNLVGANLRSVQLKNCDLTGAYIGDTIFANSDLSKAMGLDEIIHKSPSSISIDTAQLSKGKIPAKFLRGCGLRDIDIEYSKLADLSLSNDEVNEILYKIYDLRATQALQISPLFISYSQMDRDFVDKIENQLNLNGIRFWRDIHDLKAGRIEKQIDSAISQGRTVLLVLSENALTSDWVEHEVRKARELEKDMGRDILCPIALDDSWKSSRWPKRIMEQIMEYNILDFSEWQDDAKFEEMFRRLIDGLELFYKS